MAISSLTNKKMSDFFGGLEIGAVSVKWVQRMFGGEALSEIVRHEGNPAGRVQEIAERCANSANARVVVTGSTANALIDLPYRSEAECLEKSVAFFKVKPDILLSLGGETFSVYTMKEGKIRNIISSSKCAAGTGEFIVQQFHRMGYSIQNGLAAASNGKLTRIATRCSVHCKSDATHKLNKGECTPGDIARTLIHDLANKISKMVEQSQWPAKSVVISGGVALNNLFLEFLQEFMPASRILAFKESPYLEAFGASLFASELPETMVIPPPDRWIKARVQGFETLRSLKESESLLDYRVRPQNERKIMTGADYILGVDAGSTTTKIVLFNASDGSIGASSYLRTHGNPILAVQKCIEDIISQIGARAINIIQAAVTGSGREMVSVYLDNSLSFNEILAHARAAGEEMPQVDTVFEIGGQDSKFISFLKGVPIDYAMNEGCSAGTGSFLEESASLDMGIAMEKISTNACNSISPIGFGERCAAFINSDIRNALQEGVARDDVVAGLVYSIADNYISRVVGSRSIGDYVVFQGGVALNRSAALAVAARTRRKVIVPSYPELMGCIGAALMARDRLQNGEVALRAYNLNNILAGTMEIKKTFRCLACEDKCEIQIMSIQNKPYPFGGHCSKYEMQRQKRVRAREGRDLVAVRNSIMLQNFGPDRVSAPRGTIGLPMALTTYELFPLYTKIITELGYDVILSEPSKEGNAKTLAPVCYPGELVHGAVYNLMERRADYILLPYVIDMETPRGFLHGYTCPTTCAIPDLAKRAFSEISGKILSPHIGLSNDLKQTSESEIVKMAQILGVSEETARLAWKKSLSHYKEFTKKYMERSKEELSNLTEEQSIIVAGRPYITCAPEANLSLPRKIASRGYNVIPADMLPLLDVSRHSSDVWHYTQQVMNAVAHVKASQNLYICLVSCFSCGPDASMYHLVREKLAGQVFCYLEIDSHTAHAGFETRVGAFLDIIEERRRTNRYASVNVQGDKKNFTSQKAVIHG